MAKWDEVSAKTGSQRTRYRKINREIEEGKLYRVAKGKYMMPEDAMEQEGDFRRACMLGGPDSIVCLRSALSYYGLDEYETPQVWIYVKNGFRTTQNFIRPVQSRNIETDIGVDSRFRGFKITNINRTLVDCFVQKRVVGSAVAIEALTLAIRKNKTTIPKVVRMAKSMKKYHLIKPTIDALMFVGVKNEA